MFLNTKIYTPLDDHRLTLQCFGDYVITLNVFLNLVKRETRAPPTVLSPLKSFFCPKYNHTCVGGYQLSLTLQTHGQQCGSFLRCCRRPPGPCWLWLSVCCCCCKLSLFYWEHGRFCRSFLWLAHMFAGGEPGRTIILSELGWTDRDLCHSLEHFCTSEKWDKQVSRASLVNKP